MIISSACRAVINGEKVVIPVMRHSHFFRIMKDLHCDYDKSNVEQGFLAYDELTHRETFLDRKEAFKHARDCGQMPWEAAVGELFSEDIF